MGTKVEIKQGAGVSVFLVLLLIASAAFGIWQYGKAKKATEDSKKLSSALISYTDSLTYQKIKLNDTIEVLAAKTKAIYMNKQTLSKLYSKEISNAKALGIRLKDIQTMQQVATVIRDTVLTPVYVDSLQRLCTSFNDNFVSIATCIPRIGDGQTIYSIKDSIQIVEYYKPHKIFWGLIKWSSRTGEYGAFSTNPKSKIIGFRIEKLVK